MTEYSIERATKDHCLELGQNMRLLDEQELWASLHQEPTEGLIHALGRSREAFTGLANGKPFCMFGVASVKNTWSWGCPWLLTSVDIEKHKRQLIKYSAPVAHYWVQEMYPYLLNYIDARHKPALRWAKHIGFEVHNPIITGPDNMPFHPIIMRRN